MHILFYILFIVAIACLVFTSFGFLLYSTLSHEHMSLPLYDPESLTVHQPLVKETRKIAYSKSRQFRLHAHSKFNT